jgi:orotidine-5'-phosphate decarboxylase
MVRTPNKSAAELQDLMTGARLVHAAAADMVNRYGETILGKCGYSQLAVVTSATNAAAVSCLRGKYNRLFLLVDGLDYPGGNGKNASCGFDRFGHGCAVTVGPAITAAWKEKETDGSDYVQQAVAAAERIRNNLGRYISIL